MATYDAKFDGSPIWNATKTRNQLMKLGYDATALYDPWVNVYRHALGVDPVESKILIPYSVAQTHFDTWAAEHMGGTLTLRQDTQVVNIVGIRIAHGTVVGPVPAGSDMTKVPYLASVYDGRWLLQLFTVDRRYNVRRKIDPDTYAPNDYWHKHSRNPNNQYQPWSWSEILTDLWSLVAGLLGPLDLSGFQPPAFHPEGYDFSNVSLIDALRQVLADSFSTIRPDPLKFDDKFSVIPCSADLVSDSVESLYALHRADAPYLVANEPGSSQLFLPETVRVVFPALRFDYRGNAATDTDIFDSVERHGSAPHHAIDVTVGSLSLGVAFPMPVGGSTVPVHAPRFARYDREGNLTNGAELTTYANLVASRYVLDRYTKAPGKRVRFTKYLFNVALNPRIREIDFWLASYPDRGIGTQVIEGPHIEGSARTNLHAPSGASQSAVDGSLPSIMPAKLVGPVDANGEGTARILAWDDEDNVVELPRSMPIREAMNTSRGQGARGFVNYHPQSKEALFWAANPSFRKCLYFGYTKCHVAYPYSDQWGVSVDFNQFLEGAGCPPKWDVMIPAGGYPSVGVTLRPTLQGEGDSSNPLQAGQPFWVGNPEEVGVYVAHQSATAEEAFQGRCCPAEPVGGGQSAYGCQKAFFLYPGATYEVEVLVTVSPGDAWNLPDSNAPLNEQNVGDSQTQASLYDRGDLCNMRASDLFITVNLSLIGKTNILTDWASTADATVFNTVRDDNCLGTADSSGDSWTPNRAASSQSLYLKHWISTWGDGYLPDTSTEEPTPTPRDVPYWFVPILSFKHTNVGNYGSSGKARAGVKVESCIIFITRISDNTSQPRLQNPDYTAIYNGELTPIPCEDTPSDCCPSTDTGGQDSGTGTSSGTQSGTEEELGPCCVEGQPCQMTTQEACTLAGGSWFGGVFSSCSEIQCPGDDSGTGTGSETGTGTSSGSGTSSGTSSGSDTSSGTSSGSDSSGTSSGSDSGTGTSSGSDSGTGTSSGSDSGTGTSSGSDSSGSSGSSGTGDDGPGTILPPCCAEGDEMIDTYAFAWASNDTNGNGGGVSLAWNGSAWVFNGEVSFPHPDPMAPQSCVLDISMVCTTSIPGSNSFDVTVNGTIYSDTTPQCNPLDLSLGTVTAACVTLHGVTVSA